MSLRSVAQRVLAHVMALRWCMASEREAHAGDVEGFSVTSRSTRTRARDALPERWMIPSCRPRMETPRMRSSPTRGLRVWSADTCPACQRFLPLDSPVEYIGCARSF